MVDFECFFADDASPVSTEIVKSSLVIREGDQKGNSSGNTKDDSKDNNKQK